MLQDRAHANKDLPAWVLPSEGHRALAQKLLAGALIYYLLALVCIDLSRQPQEIATMWLPDAFASIYLLLLPSRQRPWLVAALALVIPLANLSYGDPWRIAISFVPANLTQIVLATWLLTHHANPRQAVTDPWQLLRSLALGGMLPSIVGASVAAIAVPFLAGIPLGPSVTQLWLSWLISSFFGVATLLPLGLWIMAKGLDFTSLRRPGVPLALGLVAFTCWGALRWLPFSFAYVITALVFTALFGGFVVAALAALLASVVLNTGFALGAYQAVLPADTKAILVVLPMLIAVIPTVLIGAIREGLQMQFDRAQRGEALQRSMLDASPNLLCLVDEKGRVVRMNAAGARMLGATDSHALQGRRFDELVHIDADAGPTRAKVHTLDGRTLLAEWHREPLHLQSLESAAVYALRDITAELDAQHMREQATRSEADSKAKSEFLSRMGHELRTPLNAVLGYAQVMDATLQDAPRDKQREYLGQITQAGWHLLAMIDDVLELSRLEAGAGTPKIQPVSLGTVAEQACAMVQTEATRKGVHVTLAPADHAMVLADPLRLRQVLINLLSNAVKYNRAGGDVRIACQQAGTRWTLSVTDNGLGISEAQQAHVFEPFNRLDQSGSEIAGTGIGLSITRKLLEAMNGQIGFSSQLGQGSSFWISLPAANPAQA